MNYIQELVLGCVSKDVPWRLRKIGGMKKMKITDEAQALIKKAIDSSDYDCLAVMLKESCCGTSVDIWLGNLEAGDEPEIIKGIPVMMDARAKERTENVTLTVENGELVVREQGPSCCC